MNVDFYFDFSSPYAYLGSTQVPAMIERHQATLTLQPMLLGGLLKLLDSPTLPMTTFSDAKRQHYAHDMQRAAAFYDVELNWPSTFPMLTVAPLRLLLAAMQHLPEEQHWPLIHAIFRAYWVNNQNISEPQVLSDILKDLNLDTNLLEQLQNPDIKQALKDHTQHALEQGVFGAPTFVVNNMLFWGQDRLHFVERALEGWQPACG